MKSDNRHLADLSPVYLDRSSLIDSLSEANEPDYRVRFLPDGTPLADRLDCLDNVGPGARLCPKIATCVIGQPMTVCDYPLLYV